MPKADTFWVSDEVVFRPSASQLVEVVLHRVQVHVVQIFCKFWAFDEEVIAVDLSLFDGGGSFDIVSYRPVVRSMGFRQVDQDDLKLRLECGQEVKESLHLGGKGRSGRGNGNDEVTLFLFQLIVCEGLASS